MTAQAGDTQTQSPALASHAGAGLDAADTRAATRKAARARRAALAPRWRRIAALHAARQLSRRLPALAARRPPLHIALYLPAGSELDTTPLIERLARHHRLYLPTSLADGSMRMLPWRPGQRLRRGAFDIRVPARAGIGRRAAAMDVVLLPLSAWDAEGNRLGAGAGYYDRWLASVAHRVRPLRIGYAFTAQRADALPREPWDVPLHAVATERGLSRVYRNTNRIKANP